MTVAVQGRTVPVAVWLPVGAEGPRPLVLMGHGGNGQKRAVAPLAELLASEHGMVVAAVDGPVHGSRRKDGAPPEVVLAEFRALWREGRPRIDEMVADWQGALDELVRYEGVDRRRIAWYGVSMGTAYGLPLVAADHRIQAAVLGLWGLSYPSTERLALDAPRVRCPVLFQRKADDELFTPEGQIELFSLLGSAEKRLAVYPGRHGTPSADQQADVIGFLTCHLEPGGLATR
jgi:dienelactone hydrolase